MPDYSPFSGPDPSSAPSPSQGNLPHGSELLPVDFNKELNEEQYDAVTSSPGPALVLAGAGSGKTRTLTYRVAWLLSQSVRPGEILLVTFTNKAAREMLHRVEDLTGVPASWFWGGTFHSIGQRFLRMHGKSIGIESQFTILDEKDAETLFGQVVRELDAGFVKKKDNPKPRVMLDIVSYARNTMKPLKETIQERYEWFEDLSAQIEKFAAVYSQRKLERQVADYDDLLELWLKLLETDADVACHYQDRFKHILVDEYQDTNPLQARIIDAIGKHHQIMAVGDDAQCIYTWRGADFKNIMDFPERHPGTRIYKIETNYRSTPEILQLANGILASQPLGTGYHKELRAVRDSDYVPFIVPTMESRQQAQFIIKRLEGLRDEGYRMSDIAVLYRAHFHALDLQIELSKRQIPFVITSGVKFFEQAHIRDLVAQLRFIANPRDTAAFIRFCSLLPKIAERTALKLYRMGCKEAEKQMISIPRAMTADPVLKGVPEPAREDWTDMWYTLQDVEEAWGSPTIRPAHEDGNLFSAQEHNPVAHTPAEVIKIAIEGWYGDYLRNIHTNWESRREDLDSLTGFASRFEDMTELLTQLVLLNSETSDRSVELNEDSMRLTTIHQAKGLEYPIVFVIGLADGMFPLKRAIDAGDVEEERRLFYVAVTRAQDQLYLTYPSLSSHGGPSMYMQPSRFLEELPSEHYERLTYKPTHDW